MRNNRTLGQAEHRRSFLPVRQTRSFTLSGGLALTFLPTHYSFVFRFDGFCYTGATLSQLDFTRSV